MSCMGGTYADDHIMNNKQIYAAQLLFGKPGEGRQPQPAHMPGIILAHGWHMCI